MLLRNKLLILVLSMTLLSNMAWGQGQQTFVKELIGDTSRDVGEVVTYHLKPACNSLTGDCGDLTIVDTLPNGMVIDSCVVPTGFTINSCVTGGKDIEIVKDTVFDGGDAFIIEIKAVIELDTSPSVDIVNSSTATITDPEDPLNSDVTASAEVIDVNDKVPNWSVSKVRTSPSSSLKPTWDTDVSYRVDFCSDSAVGNVNLTNVVMEDVFPTNAVVISDGGGTVTNGDTLTWDLGDIELSTLYPNGDYSSKKCISKSYVLRYPDADFNEDDAIQNRVTVTGTPDNGGAGITEVDLLDDIIGIPTPGATLNKWANDVLPNEDLNWGISMNINSSNAPVPNLVLYETLPTTPVGVVAKSVSSGQWNSPATTNEVNGSDVQAQITYATDSAGDCANATYSNSLTGGFIASPSSSTTYILPSNTTCIRWEFEDKGADGPAVPRGWAFTSYPRVIQDTTAYTGAFPIEVENCVNATYTNFDLTTGDTGSKCGTANIEEATPEIIVTKSVNNSNLKPGDEAQFTLRFRHDTADSTGPTENPTITDLLPAELEFVSWDSVSGLGGESEPNLEIIDDWKGTGRTLLRYSWATTAPANSIQLDGSAGVDNPASFIEGRDVRILFTVRVKSATLANTYTNSMEFFDNSLRSTCNSGTVVDTTDLDEDTDTTEEMCRTSNAVVVLQAAVLGGEKWIKGDSTLDHINFLDPTPANNAMCPNDGGFTRYPCVAQNLRGGDFEYLFKVTNVGNEPLDEYVIYDVFPHVGDVGVGEPLSGSTRGTRWRPTLQSAVTAENAVAIAAMAQTGSVIEYSTASNPCRPELSSTADETGWDASCTDDWGTAPADLSTVTAFRIKIPFSDTSWTPGDEMQFKVHMKTPTNALLSDITDASNLAPAWNSFAHRVTQASDDSRLSTAEPRIVGIVVPKGPPVSIGSIIWNDENSNGLQDSGESLLAESTTFTLLDNEGRAVTDNDNVLVQPLVSTDGRYIFSNLPEGNYSITVTPPSNYLPSDQQSSNDNNDTSNDSNIKLNNGDGTYTSAIFELTDNGEPIEANSFENSDAADSSDDDNGNMTVDFGFYKAASIGNRVWLDGNANGIQDNGEVGIADVTIRLYDGSNNELATTTSDGDGLYSFEGLLPGDYYLKFDIPEAYNILTQKGAGSDGEKDSDVDLNGTTELTTLEIGEDDTSWDMGLYRLVSLGDTVWYDTNKDGVQDATETGVEGVKVTLLKDCTTEVAQSVTDEKGNYIFRGLIPADYCLEFSDLPVGYLISPKDATNDEKDSDVNQGTAITESVTLRAEENNLTIDMGIYNDKLATLGDTVWYDDNKDGIQDATEIGVEGVKVTLYDSANTVVATTVTDEQGNYIFRDLVPAEYSVGFTDLPAGYTISPKNATGSTTLNDSDVEPTTGKTDATTLSVGENDLSWDMGIYNDKLATLGDTVWYDDNKDGIQDATEIGVEGVKVILYDNGGNEVKNTVTDEQGTYLFRDLVPAEYSVGFTGLPSSYKISPQNRGLDDEEDSNVNPITGKTELTTLSVGENDLSWDMGIYSNSLAIIGDAVWYDDNRNGVQDEDEKGVEAVKVTLYDSSDAVVAVTTTDRNGVYQFRDLVPNVYSLGFSDLPVDYMMSPKDMTIDSKDSDVNGVTGRTVTTELTEGEVDLSWDMGIYSNRLATIGDAVWYDDNRDGVQDPSEKGVEAIKVTLYKDGCNSVFRETTTDRDGVYQFRDLSAGTYCVGFADLPVGYQISPQNVGDERLDSDVNPSRAKTAIITVDEGEHNLSFDMGIYHKNLAIIGDAVWYDDDRNGIQDDTEKGVEAIRVDLYDSSDVLVASTTTDEDGNYQFRDLTPAEYYLVLADLPVGYEITTQDVGSDGQDSDVNALGRTALTQLTEGEVDLSWDMGIFTRQRASIGNHVWYDENRNGLQDATEKGVEAIKVTLYDINNNLVATTTTDSNGIYQFRDLLPAKYHVGFSDLPVGYEITVQNAGDDSQDSDADVVTGETVVTLLSEGENDLSWDMGIYNTQRAALGDTVWYDDNKDGIQDSNEFGVDAVKVTLYRGDDTLVSSTITDDRGNYKFGNLLPDDYYVVFSDLPVGYQATAQNIGSDLKDSDANRDTLRTETTTLEAGENDLSWDMGIHNELRASIGDTVWYDDNKNGLQDAYEFGVTAVKVTLYSDEDVKIAETLTDDRGNYAFRSLLPDTYYLVFSDIPAGYEVTSKNAGDSSKDSDVDTETFRTEMITVDAGENDLSWDMGLFNKERASLGNKVWFDENHNGLQDIDEKGVSAVKITLYDSAGNVVATTRTNEYGEYIFRDLLPAEYYVGFTEFPAGYMITEQNVDDDLKDSDANYHRGETIHTVLESGENDLSWDVGLYQPVLVDIGDRVWYDENRNGLQDEGEAGVPNIRVTLVKNGVSQIPLEQTTTATTSVLTDENGYYRFEDIEALAPHRYHAIFDTETLPKDYRITLQGSGSDNTMDSNVNPDTGETADVVLTNVDDLTWDMGIQTLRVYDDLVTANTEGSTTIIDVLGNDNGNIDSENIHFLVVDDGEIIGDNETAVGGASLNTTNMLVVEGEGTWSIEDGMVTFTAEDGFEGIPTPVYYIVEGSSGQNSNVGQIQFATECVCDTYAPMLSDSIPSLNTISMTITLLLISVMGALFFRRELNL